MSAQDWGRVDADGTVWVRTADGERAVGSYPGVSEADALAYFARKFDDLVAQVDLLEQRMRAGQVSPGDAENTLHKLTESVREAHAVGDLDGLQERISALVPLAEQRRTEVEQARREARERALSARTALVEEAEALAGQEPERIPWRIAGDRLRELFETWRTLQRDSRLDKHTEDELWKRFSHARSTFDRKRRQYFGVLDEQRSEARAVKEAIVTEAEALALSTDWNATAAAFRDLMNRWRAAGRASRKDDDALWARFRAAQDAFFAARQATLSRNDSELRGNLEVKEGLLAEAERLVPVTDVAAARSALRDIQERWESAGKVPRSDLNRIEGRLRRVEQSVREAEQERWTRTNPEARARAEAVVTQLEQTITGLRANLDSALAAGDQRRASEAEQALAAREEWLAQARQSLAEFG
jgi:hypothetical protein